MSKLSFNPEYENCTCNYCGGFDFKTLSKKDRYGLNAKTVICKKCGLIFINPRMTNESYRKFYQDSYRGLLLKYKNREEKNWNLEKNFVSAEKLGSSLARSLAKDVNSGTIIEIGSSTGGILAGFKSVFPDLEVLGIEPSEKEANFANLKHINTKVGLIEGIKLNLPKADNIIIVRSLNHLLDPKYFFSWAYNQLKDNGKLVIVVLDFVKSCNRRNKILTQIDHPFMFTPGSLKNFVESSGFKIELFDLTESPDYIKLVAKKTHDSPNVKIEENLYSETIKKLNPSKLYFSYLANKMIKRIWLKS
ncbi:MAG: methyltransferase domain-containing protein [Patescibacteria group bacterium]